MYKYKDVPKGKKVIWIKLIKPYDEYWKKKFPKDMEVGDITWALKKDDFCFEGEDELILFENNRYEGNFRASYFQIVNKELTYEIY